MKLEQEGEVGCWSNFCDNDSNMEPLLQCSGCDVARYCGKECQQTDGQRHENFCRGIARSKWMKSLGSVVIPGMDVDNDTLRKMLLTSTDHCSTKLNEQTVPSRKEHTSPGLRELPPLRVEEHTFPSLMEHNSHSLEEHIVTLKEESCASHKHASLNLNEGTPLDLTKYTSLTLEENTSLNLSESTPLNHTKYGSVTHEKPTSLSLKKYTSPCVKKFNSPGVKHFKLLEEHTSHGLKHVSAIIEEHISNILENYSPREYTSSNIDKPTSHNLQKHTSPGLEEHASPSVEEHISSILKETVDSFELQQDLKIDRQIVEETKINVESVICVLCKFMFPGGTRFEDFSEVFFTHLKDDHGILHNHLYLLECSMVPVNTTVTSSPPSTWTCELPKSEERRKRIRGC